MRHLLTVTLVLMFLPLAADSFPTPQLPWGPLTYTACQTSGELLMDGRLDEPDWQAAPWTADFVDIEGELKPAPFLRTRAKLLWDNDFLYIGAELEEPHIWATLSQRDAVIFHDNDFEVFIDPDGDTHDYYELEINAMGTLWDLLLIKPYRDRQQVRVLQLRGPLFLAGGGRTDEGPASLLGRADRQRAASHSHSHRLAAHLPRCGHSFWGWRHLSGRPQPSGPR